ncbi:hypothetical protein PIROE2DRAFT_16881 [Piromyces sp. E2]|nr:hypothetical protein PIROE2DRAFT_16881 [Piromyces sp. E2]|eukprot:OUM57975.1 hypothetical protein PIROE2DRAFT_16881 [Piromyces sp. E2]
MLSLNNHYQKELIPLIKNKDDHGVESLLKKSNKHHNIININCIEIKRRMGIEYVTYTYNPFSLAINNKLTNIIKLMIDYVNQIILFLILMTIIMKLKQIKFNYLCLLNITDANNDEIDIVKLLLNYSIQHQIILNINDDIEKKKLFSKNIKSEIIKLLIDYANHFNITINIDILSIYDYKYHKRNILQLLFNYANDQGILLNINEKDRDGFNPLISAIESRNCEYVVYLTDLASMLSPSSRQSHYFHRGKWLQKRISAHLRRKNNLYHPSITKKISLYIINIDNIINDLCSL